jgi:hypothetical protein
MKPGSAMLIVRRDGRDGLMLVSESRGWYEAGDYQAAHYVARRQSQKVGIATFTVQVSGSSVELLQTRPLIPRASVEESLDLLAECAIGDHLDQLSANLEAGGPVQEVVCHDSYVQGLAKRAPVPDAIALGYIASKSYWSKKLHQPAAVFTHGDAVRLAQGIQDLRNLADDYQGEWWAYYGEPQHDGFLLRPSQALMQRGPRLTGPGVAGPIFDISDRLTEARYDASAQQLRKAYGFLAGEHPDYENAAKEAVGALESLARQMSGEATLGRSAATLLRRGAIDPPTAKILTDLYEYRNRTPGVGHGAETPAASELFEARLIVNLCASALLFLVELDS